LDFARARSPRSSRNESSIVWDEGRRSGCWRMWGTKEIRVFALLIGAVEICLFRQGGSPDVTVGTTVPWCEPASSRVSPARLKRDPRVEGLASRRNERRRGARSKLEVRWPTLVATGDIRRGASRREARAQPAPTITPSSRRSCSSRELPIDGTSKGRRCSRRIFPFRRALAGEDRLPGDASSRIRAMRLTELDASRRCSGDCRAGEPRSPNARANRSSVFGCE